MKPGFIYAMILLMIFSRLLLLFIVVPIAELALLLEVGDVLGVLGTVALVIATGIVGATLARLEGLKLIFDIRNDLDMGRIPAPRLIDGMLILVAAALLVTPGILTDIVGFSLLIPAFRKHFKRWLRDWFRKRINKGSIEVDYREW